MAKRTAASSTEPIPQATASALDPIHISDEEIPSFEVVERRIKYGDSSALQGPAIELINQVEPMTLYWGNTGREGRHFQLTKRKGWIPVRMNELANRLDIGGEIQETPDGIVARGEKAREVLYKMPTRFYKALQQRKADDNVRRSRSASKLKQDTQGRMVEDAEKSDGSRRDSLMRGADHMNRMTVDLTEGRDRVELDR
jgi:hypothetical protein